MTGQKYGLVLMTPPDEEPVELDLVKQFCRIDIDDDDNLVASLITDARQRCEDVSERALIQQTYKLVLDHFPGVAPIGIQSLPFGFGWAEGWPVRWSSFPHYHGYAIHLPRPPLMSVTSIQYVDTTGETQTLDPSLYIVDASQEPGRITPAYGKMWPATRHQIAAVTVTYVAGYGADASSVPARLQQRIMNHVAYCYENRVQRDEHFLNQLFEDFFCGTY